ncbi:helical backbone metal receptor [bacterium]|nr:helical backbone metal receptor [bacterium]
MNLNNHRLQPLFAVLPALLALIALVSAAAGPVYKRIISIGPNVTETVYALGAQDRLVGVSDFCNYPPEAAKLRRVGGPANPRLETISALKPDLIVMQFATPAIRSFAAARGIAVAEVHMDSIATIERDIAKLGTLLGRMDKATSLTTAMRRDLNSLKHRVDAIPAAKRPLVFMSVDRQPGSMAGVLTASDRSFLGEALKLAGGRNAFGDMPRAYGEISRESLVARRPEIILELRGETVSDTARDQLARDWDSMSSLPAVTDKRIRVIGGDDLLVPGPRLAKTVRAIHAALYGR